MFHLQNELGIRPSLSLPSAAFTWCQSAGTEDMAFPSRILSAMDWTVSHNICAMLDS